MEQPVIKEAEVEQESPETTVSETEETTEQPRSTKTPEQIEKQRMQNLGALVILLGGLFVGSLFVDFLQLVGKQGFSQRALKDATVVESAGKTWVAYPDPKIQVQVLSDATCENCNTDQALVSIRRAMPTIEAVNVDVNTSAGKKLLAAGQVKSLPAFFFSPALESSAIFAQAQALFTKTKDNWYALDTNKIGIPAGKYLELPQVGEGALTLGNPEAKLKVVEFSDWQCPYCKAMQPAIKQMLQDYKDQVYYVYKQLPLNSIHPQAENAALAVECVNEQDKTKWFAYGDHLFSHQDEWSRTTGTQKFKDYARTLKLDGAKFDQCLNSQKYLDKVNTDAKEGESFGISGTPGTFVGSQFLGGYLSADDFKKIIDDELKK